MKNGFKVYSAIYHCCSSTTSFCFHRRLTASASPSPPRRLCFSVASSLLSSSVAVVQEDLHSNTLKDQLKELIGTGVRRDGLYYFGEGNSVHYISINGTASTLDLWHKRMGHPSKKVVKLLPPYLQF